MSTNDLQIRPLSKQLAEIVANDFGETADLARERLRELRTWISQTPHLAACVQNGKFLESSRARVQIYTALEENLMHTLASHDQFLISFLRGCQYDMELTKAKLDRYYSIRHVENIIYSALDPLSDEVQSVLKMGIILPLLKPLKDGSRVILTRLGIHDPDKVTAEMIARIGYYIATILHLEDDHSTVVGHTALYDARGGTLKLYFQFTFRNIKRMIYAGEKIQPVMQRQVHFFNIPRGGEVLFNVAKLFLSNETSNKLFVHSKIKNVFEKIPIEIMPPEYGGAAESIAELTDYWKEKVESYRDYFIEQQSRMTDESKRIGEMDSYVKAFADIK